MVEKVANKRRCCSERQFLHEQVHGFVDFESVQISAFALQTHQQSAERHVSRPVISIRGNGKKRSVDRVT